MKKVTNKLLFSGLAIIIVAFFVIVFSMMDFSDREEPIQDIRDDLTETEGATETRQLDPFDGILTSGNYIKYVKSEKYELEIPSSKEVNEMVYENKLHISVVDKDYNLDGNVNTEPVVVYSPVCKIIENLFNTHIECDEIDSDTITITNRDNGVVLVEKMDSKRVKLVNKSDGSINIANIDADYLNVRTEDVGSVTISGTARKAVISCEGTGKIDISGMTCPDISIQEGEENVITRKE